MKKPVIELISKPFGQTTQYLTSVVRNHLLQSFKLQIWHLLRARRILTFWQTIKCRFTLKLVLDIITTQFRQHQYVVNSPYCWSYSSQRMFVIQFFCVVGYEFGTNLKCRVNISILFWGRGLLFKMFPVTRDTFSKGFAFPNEIRFFLIASFPIFIGNLSSRVILTINFHMVFRTKLAVVLLLLRPEFEFIPYVKSLSIILL